jgi:plasmid stabilization system protein ParE
VKVRYTTTAFRELSEIVSYIAGDNARAAANFLDDIERTISLIVQRPELAPVVYRGDVRAKLVGRHQYRVFYVVAGDELIVRNIRSTRQLRPWEQA